MASFIFRRTHTARDLFFSPSFALAKTHGTAVALGIFSALCYALRNLILKSAVQEANGSQLMLSQVIVISLCFAPFLSVEKIEMSFGVLGSIAHPRAFNYCDWAQFIFI